MNILVDIRSLLSGPYSGVGVYTFHLLEALFCQGKEHTFYLFYNSLRQPHTLPKFSAPNTVLAGFHYPNKLLNASFSLFNAPSIDKLIEHEFHPQSEEPAAVLASLSIDLVFTPNWLFSAYSSNSKKVITLHDLAIFRVPEYFSLKQKLWHTAIRIPRLVQEADAVICVSESTRHDAITILGIPENKLCVISEGVSSLFLDPKSELQQKSIKEKYQLPDEFIFTACNREPRKNILGMIEAFEYYKKISKNENMQFVIAGQSGWNPAYERRIKKRIAASAARNAIRLLGYVKPPDLPFIMSQARVFLFLSFYEGFGLPPLEAMACGTPVIASFAPSLPETLGNAAMLVDPHNINDTAFLLVELLNSPALAQIYRERGYARAKQFSWEKAGAETLELFEKIGKKQ